MKALERLSSRYLQTALLIIPSACIIFYPFFSSLVKQYLSIPWSSHALIIPIASVYILYREIKKKGESFPVRGDFGEVTFSIKKDHREKERIIDVVIGVGLIAISLATFYTQSSTMLKLGGVILYLIGSSIFFYGIEILLIIIKPALYLFLMYPVSPGFLYTYGASLSTFTARTVYEILKVFRLSPHYSENPIPVISFVSARGEDLAFAIDLPCMGAFMLIGFASFAIFLACVTEGSRMKKMGTSIVGVLLMVSLNIIRIFIISIIGYFYGSEIALQSFHTFGGWALFTVGITIYLMINSKLIKKPNIFIVTRPQLGNLIGKGK